MSAPDRPNFRDLLGRTIWHDPASKGAAFRAPMATDVRSVDHTHYGPYLHQWVGSCTGHSLAQWLNFAPAHKPRGRYYFDDDAMRFYSGGTRRDPFVGTYPPTDTGSSGLAVCKEALASGDIAGYDHAFGLEQALLALSLPASEGGRPLMVGTSWLEDMFDLDADGFLRVGGDDAGGHEYVIFRNNARGRYVWVQNHWRGWGLPNSRAKLRWDDLDQLLRNRGDVIVPRPLPR